MSVFALFSPIESKVIADTPPATGEPEMPSTTSMPAFRARVKSLQSSSNILKDAADAGLMVLPAVLSSPYVAATIFMMVRIVIVNTKALLSSHFGTSIEKRQPPLSVTLKAHRLITSGSRKHVCFSSRFDTVFRHDVIRVAGN